MGWDQQSLAIPTQFLVAPDKNLVVKKPSSGFLTRSDTNSVQPQKMARGLKFGI